MRYRTTAWFADDMEAEVVETDYVSLVNDKTFGIPPLSVGSKDETTTKAERGQSVLYVNTSGGPAMFKVEAI